jgi:hypothetical protein
MPMIDSACGVINAAAAPCTMRPAISVVASGASPQTAEESVNSARPIEKTRRRPTRSPSRPPRISPAASAIP